MARPAYKRVGQDLGHAGLGEPELVRDGGIAPGAGGVEGESAPDGLEVRALHRLQELALAGPGEPERRAAAGIRVQAPLLR